MFKIQRLNMPGLLLIMAVIFSDVANLPRSRIIRSHSPPTERTIGIFMP
jgi:hypothetical protein